MKKLSLAITLLILTLAIKAQSDYRPGYIIKNNGDSLVGLVYYTYSGKFEKSCHFKRFEIAEEFVYKPGMIKAYGFRNGRRFESKKEGNKNIFYECLLKGPVSLYAKTSNHSKLYIETERDGFVRLNNGSISVEKGNKTYTGYKEYIASVTNQDKQVVNQKISAYSAPAIVNYLRNSETKATAFHVTTDKNFMKDYSLTRGSSMWKIGITGGYQMLFIKIPGTKVTKYFANADYNYSYRPAAGLFINRRFSRYSDLVSADISLLYFSDTYYGYAEYKNVWPCQDDILIEFSAVQLPVSLKFTLGKPESKMRTVIKVGGYKSFLLDYKYTRTSDQFVHNNIYSTVYSDYTSKGDFGARASVGFDIPLSYRTLGIEVGYSRGWQKLKGENEYYDSNVNSNCIQLILQLSL
jgi:hypothetical protein